MRGDAQRQEGRYCGLGITIASIDSNITAQGRVRNSPASRSGFVMTISSVASTEDAKGWTTEQAMKRLRGRRHASQLEIRRRGYARRFR
jgi:hypothetical protein